MGCCSSCCTDESEIRSHSTSRRRDLKRTSSRTDSSRDMSIDGVPITDQDTQEQLSAEMSAVVDLLTHSIAQESNELVQIIYDPASPSKGHQCAYCDDPNGDYYDYFYVPYYMPLDLLEEFMEHGWWRTGKVVFRPRFDIVCCPGYSTRLPVSEYNLTKKHRKVIRKWGEFLKNGNTKWENRGAVINTINGAGMDAAVTSEDEFITKESLEKSQSSKSLKRVKKPVTPGKGADPTKPPCKKAKVKRAELKQAHNVPPPVDVNSSPHPHNNVSLTDLIAENTPQLVPGQKHIFETKLLSVNPRDPLLTATLPRAYELYDKLQRLVHPTKVRFKSQGELEQGFFDSPLQSSYSTDRPQGSYHLQYYLDGELVMYSVIDILPHYFVSIYFVYDPDIRFMTPGIFTCLYEINLVQKLQQTMPDLQYYGLGYYNHFDDKASYKRQFKPQEVLCNETNIFVSLESVIPKFQEQKYSRLVDESVPEKEGRIASINMLYVSKRYIPLHRFSALSTYDKNRYQESLKLFIAEAGSTAAHKCCIDLASNFEQ